MSKQLTLSSLLSVIIMIGFIAANNMVPETRLASAETSAVSALQVSL